MTTLPKHLQSAEHATCLPVDQFYALAIDKLEEVHGLLDKLPKNPFGDDTPTLEFLKKDFQVNEGDATDFSMFLMGGMQMAGLDLASGALGLSAATSQFADVAMGYMSERADNDNRKKPSAKSAFGKASKKNTAGTRYASKLDPVKKPLIPATRLLRAAMAKKQMDGYKKTLKTRRSLERKLSDLKEMFQQLNMYKTLKVTDVMMTEDGKVLRALNNDKPIFVHKPDEMKYRKRLDAELKLGMKIPAGAVPSLKMGF